MSRLAEHDDFFNQLEHLMIADPVEAALRARSNLESIDNQGTVTDQLRLRRMLVMALSHSSQFQDALDVVDSAFTLDGAHDSPEELARIRLASMQPLAHLGRIDEAMEEGMKARTELEALGSESLAGRASLNVGAIQAMTGHHQESIDSFDRALQRLQSDRILAGQIQTNRGSALTALDRFVEAEAAFSQAGELLGEEMPWAAAVVEGNLADLAARQGSLHKSLRHFEASRRYLEKEDALGDVGRLDAEEATVLSMLGMTTLATELFERARNILREHGTPADLAMARLGYGRALTDAGDLDTAEALLLSMEGSIDSEESPDLYRQYLGLSAHIAIEKADWDSAERNIEMALVHVGDRPVQRATWHVLEARIAYAKGEIQLSNELLSKALELATKAHISPLIASVNERLSQIARELGDDETADAYARDAIDGYESIRGTIQADQMRKVWHQGRLGIYGDFALALMQRDSADAQSEAFEIVERIRSRTLLDVMHQSGSDIDDNVALTADEVPLVDELNGHRRWMNWMYSSLAMGNELTEEQRLELIDREAAAQRLENRLAMLRPEFGVHTPIDLPTVQAQISQDAILLSYLVIDDQVSLQVVDSNTVHGVPNLMEANQLSELVSDMQFQVGRALVSGTKTVSARREARLKRDMDLVLEELNSVLIQPVEHLLEGKSTCIVIPSGDLHSVPFAALRQGDAYLVDKFAVTTAPGVSVLAGMTGKESSVRPMPKQPLVVGVFDENAPGLAEEAISLAERMHNPTLLLNESASKPAVVQALEGPDLIHLACHGRFDPAFPNASGLQLRGGWLTLDDIREIRLNQPLMVLSGCETGRARVDQGDDLVGLMTAMVASGAAELVSSLWKTHDHAALALMRSFYAALEGGSSVTSALRTSQSEVKNQFAHPAMWAPFVGISKKNREILA